MDDLGNKILKAIEDTYDKKFVGVIKINKIEPQGYLINLGLTDSNEILISNSYQVDNENDLIKYFIKDLRERSLHHSRFFTEIRSEENPGLYYRTSSKIINNL